MTQTLDAGACLLTFSIRGLFTLPDVQLCELTLCSQQLLVWSEINEYTKLLIGSVCDYRSRHSVVIIQHVSNSRKKPQESLIRA